MSIYQKKMGGWQPIDAETVDRLSYGDCKALSNYMKALLNIAGIKSFYTLVLAGEDELNLRKSFPSSQFNHAMICVPLPSDTIWLECTSQSVPAGFLGKFTDDRDVLITGEGGGTIVRTKTYTIDDNVQSRYAKVDIKSDGNAESKILTDYKGTYYDDISRVLEMDEKDRKKFMLSRINIPSKEIVSFKHTENRKIVPIIKEEIILKLPNYSTLMNNKIIFNPNLLTRFGKLPYKTKDRKSPIRINRSYCEKDSLIIKLSSDLKVDKLPEKLYFKSKFGEYFCEMTYMDGAINFRRSFKFFKGNYQISEYNEFVDFCEKVYNSDERKIALIKQI